jgi:hypothetical protein
MLTYNQELIVDSDTHRVGSYYANLYEFPSSKQSTVERRDKKMGRMTTKFPPLSASKFCQKGE